MSVKRIGSDKAERKVKNRKMDPQARTWLITAGCIVLMGFVLIPLLLKQGSGANAVSIVARAERAVVDTPEPYSFEAATPSPTPVEATPEPTDSIQISKYLQLQLEDDYPTVEKLQTRLMDLGYLDSDEPNTVYNGATAAAVALFQRTLSYETTGVADIELQELLFSTEAVAYETKLGDSGADVKGMQSRLHELGYYESKINGYFGVATEEALTAFQAKNGTDVDAIFHVSDRELLYSPDARPKIDPTPTPAPTPKPVKKPSATKKPSSVTAVPDAGSATTGGSNAGSSSDAGGSSSAESVDTSTPSFSASYSPDGITSVASAMLGKPYVLSEESPAKGFDCSGLVYYCLRTCGVSTGRYNANGFSNVGGWSNIGSIGELAKGDLVFFNSPTSGSVNHAGIYIGGGRFIHASASQGKVLTSSIGSNYWTTYFINGRRVF